ncbi:MAG: hypothetical protein ACLQLG_19950 [Thermoguttaceae bacterium]
MAAVAEKTRRRWIRITPDRCVVALLALEGFLLLSAWFRWFPFNQHKGSTVLITIASVGVILLLMFLWFLAALVFRWRFQFSILALLVLTLVVAVPFSWLATEMRAARKQREALERVEKLHGSVSYDYQFDTSSDVTSAAKPPGPAWLRTLLGDDFLASVVVCVAVNDVTDDLLENLKGQTRLVELHLINTHVTDAGLEHLKGLPRLQSLFLTGTKVSDAGLKHLEGLTQLRYLDLSGTKVTAAGVKRLQQALPNCLIQP